MICDDPEALARLQNHYFDPDYEEWERQFDEEQQEKAQAHKASKQTETTDTTEPLYGEEYDISEPIDSSEEWEAVD